MLNLFLIAALIPMVPGLFFLIYFLNLLPLFFSKNTSADRLVKSINGGSRGFNFSTKLKILSIEPPSVVVLFHS